MAAAPASAATQIVSDGILTGATGVLVNGVSYDVAFVDGTCASVFGTCAQSNFAFKTTQTAGFAAQALLDQVFLDTNSGLFDSNPALTNGCTNVTLCQANVPYLVSNSYPDLVFIVAAANSVIPSRDTIAPNSFFGNDLATASSDTYARFTLSPMAAAVPEPATWAMMIVGFGLVGSTMRRRKTAVAARVRFA